MTHIPKDLFGKHVTSSKGRKTSLKWEKIDNVLGQGMYSGIVCLY